MSALTFAPTPQSGSRAAATSPPASERGPRGPRLLLPPVSEPPDATEAVAEAVLASPNLRSVLSPVTDEAWPVPTANPAVRSGRRLPDPDQLCGAVVLAAVEVLAGTRPITQLARWVTPRVLDALVAARVTPGSNREPGRPAAGSARAGAPLPSPASPARGLGGGAAQAAASASARAGTGRRPRVMPTPRATVRRVILTRVDDRTAEASVVLHDGVRVRAAAARLKVHRGHWRVTVLQIG